MEEHNLQIQYSKYNHIRQFEVTNRSLLKIIKIQFEGEKSAWAEELPNILWLYRMAIRVPMGETPFWLTFGTKAVILVEVGLMNIRIMAYEEQRNHQELNNNLDLVDEVRDEVVKRIEKCKGAMARYYNKKVKVRRFNTGDLVLRKVTQATKDSAQGKLGLASEGPYQVTRHSREGSYYLKTLDG